MNFFKAFSSWLARHATPWKITLSFILTALCSSVFFPAVTQILKATGAAGAIDPLFFPSAQDMAIRLTQLGAQGRAYYRTVELTLDLVYPVAYSLLLAWLLSCGWIRATAANHPLVRLNSVPAFTFVCDILENIGIVTLIDQWPQRHPLVEWSTRLANLSKWLSAGLCVALIVIAWLTVLVRRWRKTGN